jgi:4-hydroxyphenylacetate 3-monooxygenase
VGNPEVKGESVTISARGATAVRRSFRTGDQYKEALNDGRRVWIDGERVENLASHPVTAGVVQAHADWYDLHHDPAWDETLWRLDETGTEVPVCFTVPQTPEELVTLSEALRAAAFLNAGNISHPACWGMLVFAGLWDMLESRGIGERDRVKARLDLVCREQRFVTAAYTPPQVARFKSEDERVTVRVVEVRADGIVVRGGFGIATGAVYADEVTSSPLPVPGGREDESLFFSFAVNTPGVSMFLRRPATDSTDSFTYPLSTRFDEQDASIFLDDVFIPWEQVYVDRDPEIIGLLTQHFSFQILAQLNRMLARAEFSVGLGLAIAKSLGTTEIPAVETALTALYLHAMTIRTAATSAVRDCDMPASGVASPRLSHMSVGYMYAFDNRARMADILRNLGGQSLVTSPSAASLRKGEDRQHIIDLFGGGDLDAEQRALLWNAVRDHSLTALEGREQSYTSLATGGEFIWRKRIMGGAADSERMVAGALAVIEASGGVDLPISTRLGGSNLKTDLFVR